MDLRRRKQPVTVYDIALRAGVSPATVSRALHDAPHVTRAKREAVLAAAEALRYRPNLMAQDLASGRSQTVGLVLPDTISSVWGRLVNGVETALREEGYHLLMASAEGSEGEPRALDLLLSHQVDGLVLAGIAIADEGIVALAGEIPYVTLCRGSAARSESWIHVNNREGARQAVRHLLSLGHTCIAHVCGPQWHSDAVERRAGYADALAEAGLPLDPGLVVESDFNMRGGLVATRRLLESRRDFTALFAGSDQIALGGILALDQHGMDVPRGVSVVGFDDEPFAEFCRPPLTTVRQPLFEMGQAAVRNILASVRNEASPLPSFETQLRVRASTSPIASARRDAPEAETETVFDRLK